MFIKVGLGSTFLFEFCDFISHSIEGENFLAADLHCHTIISDGSMSIDEVVYIAKTKGLKTIAITDHDTFAGATRAVVFGKRNGVEVLHGAEISAWDFKRDRLVHILCYSCYVPDRLLGMFSKIKDSRTKAMNMSIQKIMRMYPITPDMVAKRAKGSTTIFKQHVMQTLMDAGYTDKVFGDLYSKLFNSKFGLAKTNIEYPDVFDVLDAIHEAGGVAILAHPAVYDSYDLIPELVELGLDGIECFYPRAKATDDVVLTRIADKHNLIKTGGTDFHGCTSSVVYPIGTCVTQDDQVEKIKKLALQRAKAMQNA